MRSRRIVRFQAVEREKLAAARTLRRRMTPAEARLWKHLRAGRLDGLRFRRQQVIDGFIVDFYCDRTGIVIEVDGGVHDDQADADRERERVLAERGLEILRFRNERIMDDMPGVLASISAASAGRDRATVPTSPLSPLPAGEGDGPRRSTPLARRDDQHRRPPFPQGRGTGGRSR